MTRRRMLLKLAQHLPIPRARQLLALVCAFGAVDFAQQAAAAWEDDMLPARDAVIAALQSGNEAGLRQLRADLPHLLDRLNAATGLSDLLEHHLLKEFLRTMRTLRRHGPLHAASAATQWRSRTIQPTDLGSADLRGFSSELHLRSIWSARVTNADFLNELAAAVDDMVTGKINLADARWRLMKKLKELGYDPRAGFPDDMANVPPAEIGSLQDISSQQRLDLMLRTNVQIAQNYARVLDGNTEFARYAWPAWELKRVESRRTPRGEKRVKGELVDDEQNSWETRWHAAGESVEWEGALKSVMVAKKDSPIWQALANGAGGYHDTLGHPFGPFAFNSGYDQVAVDRKRWLSLSQDEGEGMKDQESGPMQAQLEPTPDEQEAQTIRLTPDLRARLLERWAA